METSAPGLTRRFAVALAAGTLAVGAHAQSSSIVTIYGVIDGGVEYARTSATPTAAGASLKSMVTGSSAASRLGSRITEDLGGGLRASAVLEHGFDLDTGIQTGGAFWGRDSYVGLGGVWGEVRLGRTYTPAFWVQLLGDVDRLGLYGSFGRMDNNSAARFALEASSRTEALPVAAGTDTTGLVLGVRHNF